MISNITSIDELPPAGVTSDMWNSIKTRAAARDAKALQVLGGLCVDCAIERTDKRFLEKAEAFAAGNSIAIRFMDGGVWQLAKEKYLQKIWEEKG